MHLEIVAEALVDCWLFLLFQGPAQAMNIRDSLAEIKSDIVVKVHFHAMSFLENFQFCELADLIREPYF